MAYTPPGVYTEVEIANNIVQLPGGTRVLALIGLGKRTLTINSEQVTQNSTRVNDLAKSGTVNSITGAYDFSGPGGTLVVYPTTGITINSPYGSGWFLSGTTSIAWTKAANPYPTSTTPASGTPMLVTYTGSFAGTGVNTLISSEAVTQNSTFNTPLAYSGVVILGVSGTSGYIYPASGTVSGVDVYGYGITNSGWSPTPSISGNLIWGTVLAANYSYPYSNVPKVSGVYFVNYEYNKSGVDYGPRNFFDYSEVVNQYGDEANWKLDSNGNWIFQSLNTLTLGARIAFANGASVVTLVQMSGNGLSVGDFYGPLNQLQTKIVDIIVPLTGGSGSSFTEVSVSEKGLILQAVKQHCDTMSLPQNKKERVLVGSLGPAEIGDSTTADTYVYDATNVLIDKRATLIAPGIATVQIQDPAGTFQSVPVDASFMAVAFGGLSCNPNSDVATPLTNQQFASFTRLSAATSAHSEAQYLESEMNTLAAAGVCVIEANGSRIFVRHQLTTDQTNQANCEFSVVTTTDYVSQAVRFTTEQFIGKKLISAVVLPAIKSTILATMQALAGDAIINAIGAITVITNPNNPTEVLSTVQYVPIFPLNRIKVTFTIRTTI
jgi:hypothetical protein